MVFQAKAYYTIQSGEEKTLNESDGTRLTQGKFVMVYKGDLEGEGVLGELKHYFNANFATFCGMEYIIGKLKGRMGSFVIRHEGEFEHGKLTSRRFVVPGSGTGELQGLRGDIELISGSSREFTITIKYYF